MKTTAPFVASLALILLLCAGTAGAEPQPLLKGPFDLSVLPGNDRELIAAPELKGERFSLDGLGLEVAVDDSTTFDVGLGDPADPTGQAALFRPDALVEDRKVMFSVTRVF